MDKPSTMRYPSKSGPRISCGHSVAASACPRANGIDRDVLIAEHPQPSVDGVDSPTGLIGMDDVGFPKGVDEQVIGRLGQIGEPLLGADQSARTDGEVAIGLEEVTDLAIRNAQAVFEFGGHGQDHRAESVAGSADRVGGLLGMAALTALPATRTIAGLNVELCDDRDNGRQVGLILNHRVAFNEFRGAVGTGAARNLNDPIDPFGRRRGAVGWRMAFAPPRFLLAFLEFVTAKGSGLPICFFAARSRAPRGGAGFLAPTR